jgi:hypothetical protein
MITIVSGLPRSGTSMMMQMLNAGGLPALADGFRTADEDNPQGYFEFEKVKQLKSDATWLAQAEGKAVKVVTQLLVDLPADRRYKVLFMHRNLDEILASQSQMLGRRGQPGANIPPDKMKGVFERHLEQVTAWLAKQPCFDVLPVQYAEVVRQPLDHAKAVAAFLNRPMDVEKMAASVSAKLYRHVCPGGGK